MARAGPPRNLAAVVLAAGAGTRLRPLTLYRPKPLCPVGNRPVIEFALVRAQAWTDAVAVNAHHGREQLEAYLAGRVHVSVEEPEPLGTAGALGRLRDWIDGRDVLVLNADAWHHDDLSGLLAGWDGERIRLLVVDDPQRANFGPWRHCGASVMPWAVVRELRPVPSGLYEVCWRARYEAGLVELVASALPFFDCGTPGDYLRANLAESGGRSVIGDGSVVEGEVVRSVVWPDARVRPGERLVEAIRVGEDVTVTPFAASRSGTEGAPATVADAGTGVSAGHGIRAC